MAGVIVFNSAHVEELTDAAFTGAFINDEGELILQPQGATAVNAGKIGRGAGLHATNTLVAGDTDGYLDYNTITESVLNEDSTNWVDRFRGFFKPFNLPARTVMWFNEYFELRLAPAKHNTTAFVIYVRENATVQTTARNATIPLFVLRDDRDARTHFWGLYDQGVVKFGPNMHVWVPTIKLTAAEALPAGLPANVLVVRTAT